MGRDCKATDQDTGHSQCHPPGLQLLLLLFQHLVALKVAAVTQALQDLQKPDLTETQLVSTPKAPVQPPQPWAGLVTEGRLILGCAGDPQGWLGCFITTG